MKLALGILMSALFFGCSEQYPPLDHSKYSLNIREEFPAMMIPDNNPLTVASVELGKQLFFDNQLSVDKTISCANCHTPENGFADAISLSIGVNGAKGFRNSGALTNTAYLPYFNRDGGVKSLDVFSAIPIEDHKEMGFNLKLLGERLQQNEFYQYQAREIYQRPMDGFVATRALASYLRTFVSDNNLHDQFIYDNKRDALTEQQIRGMVLFNSDKANCSKCHSGPDKTNYQFENNGLYPSYANKDRGRERITLDPSDEGKFRVASLRNIQMTAPYMHDGSLSSLENVLDHYANQGNDHRNENPLIDQINLNEQDQKDIIAFLNALTDTLYLENPMFQKAN